jgi:hypothetical protein
LDCPDARRPCSFSVFAAAGAGAVPAAAKRLLFNTQWDKRAELVLMVVCKKFNFRIDAHQVLPVLC